jgi:aminoglycoside phosphotransferase (APT) family kinase protein
MLAPRLPVELVAVVDWEQSTIGDPLVDLGWLLGLWVESGDAASLAGVTPFAGRTDVPTRRELLDRYADDSDRDLAHVNYYCVLGLFKLACVMEGSYARFRAGTGRTSSSRLTSAWSDIARRGCWSRSMRRCTNSCRAGWRT